MPRHRQHRRVAAAPTATFFKPQGVPLRETDAVVLPVEGLEALRLADLEGLCAEAAAVAMGVSRHTFGRVLAEARRATATALVGGLALRIEGGSYRLADEGPLDTANDETGPAGCGADSPAEKDTDMPGQGQGGRCGRGEPGHGGKQGEQGQGGQGGQGGLGRDQGHGQGRDQGHGQGRGQGRGQGLGRGVGRELEQTAATLATPESASVEAAVTPKALERRCPTCGAAATGALCPGCGAAMGA